MTAPRRLPVLATVLVIAAAAAMVALGVWQLSRAREKEAMIARFARAGSLPPVTFPAVPPGDDSLAFRRAAGFCLEPASWRTIAGRDTRGRQGWRYIAHCRTGAEGPGMAVDAGWAAGFDLKPAWKGGPVRGVIATLPTGRSLIATLIGPRQPAELVLIAADPAPGLAPSAPPRIEDVPNNHRAYAVQWFIFAALALAIYAIALRRRWRGGGIRP